AQELSLAAARLALALGSEPLSAAADPLASARRFRGAGRARVESLAAGATVVRLEQSFRCPALLVKAGALGLGTAVEVEAGPGGSVEFWRCANDRSQAQSVAADVE